MVNDCQQIAGPLGVIKDTVIVDEVLRVKASQESVKKWVLGGAGEYNVRITREGKFFAHCEGSIQVLRHRTGEIIWEKEHWRNDRNGGIDETLSVLIDRHCDIRVTMKAHHFMSGIVKAGSSRVRVTVSQKLPDDAPLPSARSSLPSARSSMPSARSTASNDSGCITNLAPVFTNASEASHGKLVDGAVPSDFASVASQASSSGPSDYLFSGAATPLFGSGANASLQVPVPTISGASQTSQSAASSWHTPSYTSLSAPADSQIKTPAPPRHCCLVACFRNSSD
jgi:hypothetical protein